MTNRIKRIKMFLAIVILSTGCATINHESIIKVDKLEKSDFCKLNGRYSNNPSGGNGKILRSLNKREYQPKSLWANLNPQQMYTVTELNNQTVEIEFVTEKEAILTLYQGDSLIDKQKIRGKFKDSYFYRRPFPLILPFVPVLFGRKAHCLRIGKSDDALVVDSKWNFWMYFLIAGLSEKGQSSLVFRKK